MQLVSVCFHTSSQCISLHLKMNVGSLMCTTSLERAVAQKGKTGTDETAQILTGMNWKSVTLHWIWGMHNLTISLDYQCSVFDATHIHHFFTMVVTCLPHNRPLSLLLSNSTHGTSAMFNIIPHASCARTSNTAFMSQHKCWLGGTETFPHPFSTGAELRIADFSGLPV